MNKIILPLIILTASLLWSSCASDDSADNLKEVVKGEKKEGVKDDKKEGVKDDKKEGVKDDKKEGVKDDKKEGVKDDKKEGVKDDKKEGVKDDKKEGVKDDKKEGVKDDKKEGVKDDKKEGVKDEKEAGKTDSKETAVKILLNRKNLELIGLPITVSVISDDPVDYDADGNSDTDILSQMSECEKDDRFEFTKSRQYVYELSKLCAGQTQNIFFDKYTTDGNDIHFFLGSKVWLIFKNVKLYRLEKVNTKVKDSYRMSYDRKDERSGKTFRWTVETNE